MKQHNYLQKYPESTTMTPIGGKKKAKTTFKLANFLKDFKEIFKG